MEGKGLNQISHAARIRNGLAKWRDVPPGVIPDLIADELMAMLKAGSTIRKLTGGGEAGPPMVSLDRFKRYCKLHPEWADEAWRISRVNGHLGKGARKRSLTHCSFGHPLSGDNLYLYIAPGRNERKCRACLRRRFESPRPPSEEQIKRATAIFNAGGTVSQVCWGRVGGKIVSEPIVSFPKLKLYRQQNPAFNKFVLSATADNNSKGQQRRYNPAGARATISRAEANDFYTIVAMMPAYLPSDVRDDIAQSILLALLDGSLRRDQVKGRVQQFVTGHNRMFPTKFAKFGDSPLVSLDEVLFDDGSTTRGDTVSRGLWD